MDGTPVPRLFHGNETAVDTMAAFARCRMVVCYHGAGLANAIFSPRGTYITIRPAASTPPGLP